MFESDSRNSVLKNYKKKCKNMKICCESMK